METPDIGAIIRTITENPKLMEELTALANQASAPTKAPAEQTEEIAVAAEAQSVPAAARPSPDLQTRGKRQNLLRALRPYLSDKRAKALDSMEAIAGLLDLLQVT